MVLEEVGDAWRGIRQNYNDQVMLKELNIIIVQRRALKTRTSWNKLRMGFQEVLPKVKK